MRYDKVTSGHVHQNNFDVGRVYVFHNVGFVTEKEIVLSQKLLMSGLNFAVGDFNDINQSINDMFFKVMRDASMTSFNVSKIRLVFLLIGGATDVLIAKMAQTRVPVVNPKISLTMIHNKIL